MRKIVHHAPIWASAQLPIDAHGNTRDGLVCVHPLENGSGPCGGTVFSLDQAIGDHACVVDDPNWLYPTGRPSWLGTYQSWPCGRCGDEHDDSEPHNCVPADTEVVMPPGDRPLMGPGAIDGGK